jgi:hypothetical protein
MSRIVCYIPSYNDSERAAESLATCPDWDVVISDNASDEPHRSRLAALAGDRVQVIRHERQLGRVGNWKFCVEHFRASDATWMKFLSAGDRHLPETLDVFRRAIHRFPDARFFMGQVYHVRSAGRKLWKLTDQVVILPPVDAMEATARHGNIFHSLIAPLVHVDLVRDGASFGEDILSFCADLLYLMSVARRAPTYYLPEPVAEMMLEYRQTLQAKKNTLESCLEEGLCRVRAADAVGELTGDRARRDTLIEQSMEVMHEAIERLRQPTAAPAASASQFAPPVRQAFA